MSDVKNEAAKKIRAQEFTLRDVCEYLELEVPKVLIDLLDKRAAGVSYGALATNPGDIFFSGAVGEKGLANVKLAMERGAYCVFARPSLCKVLRKHDIPYVECRKPRTCVMDIARLIGAERSAKAIAVTGSIGKTSAKEMIRLVCESSLNTSYSLSNQNGLPQVIRYIQHLPKGCEVHIQETGLSKPGSIERAATVLRPDMFVVTNIGLNHVGYFDGRQEGILEEKLKLDAFAAEGAVGFVNGDDPLLSRATYQHRVVKFAIESRAADIWAEDIVERNGTVRFTAVERDGGKKTPVCLNIVGRHNVYNALCAFAIGVELGIDRAAIATALEGFRATGVRQNLVHLDGYLTFLDCYNASEGAIQSTASTLETIDPKDGGRCILVVGDIDDKLGELTEEVHRRVGRTLADHKGIDLMIFFGDHMAWAAEEARALGANVLATSDRAELEDLIRKNLTRRDVIAFKGGQQMMLPWTLDNLFGTDFYMLDGDMVTKNTVASGTDGAFKYRVFDSYGAEVTKFLGAHAMGKRANTLAGKVGRKLFGLTVEVPATFEGVPVRLVGKGSFGRTHVARVTLPEGVQAIEYHAFFECKKLRNVDLPCSLHYIGVGAFEGCSSLETVLVQEGVGTIDERAFASCGVLSTVFLPASVRTIAESAFEGCQGSLRVCCPKDSYALQWCQSRGIRTVVR